MIINKINKKNNGAAVLIAAIVVATGIVSITLSVVMISLNNQASINSFSQAVKSFYTAESAVTESLFQIKKNPNDLIFNELMLNGVTASTEFVEEGATCAPPPECDYSPGSGWWAEYFNYSVNHPDMQVDPFPGPTPTPTEHDWYDDSYKTHEQIDADLMFGDNWFPYDGSAYENKEGYSHDYHFGAHWRAKVTAPTTNNYGYSLSSDDDQWVLVNKVVVVNNSGTHPATIKTGQVALGVGDNLVEIYFAERHTVGSAMNFKFTDSNLIITPWPEGCGENLECRSNIQSTASTTVATKKVEYSCTQQIEGCTWAELVP